MMEPSEWLRGITGHFPDVAHFSHLGSLPRVDARHLAWLWISEGVPFAFLGSPGVFQAAREHLASGLRVMPRDISVTGSARLGYSLAPNKFGRAFEAGRSDIDLLIAQERLFEKISEQAAKFVEDFASGEITPRNPTELGYWSQNSSILPQNISDGFVDAFKVPTLNRYPAIQKINQSAFQFVLNVNTWSRQSIAKKCSVRVYRNWNCAIEQISFNIRSGLKYRQQE